jgi:acetolactate synthase-1/2/3 large subunit
LTLENYDSLKDLSRIFSDPTPDIIEVMVDPDMGFQPKLVSQKLSDGKIISPNLSNMFPFLDEKTTKIFTKLLLHKADGDV